MSKVAYSKVGEYEFPADDSLIDFEKIKNWILNLYEDNNLNERIQTIVFEKLNWKTVLAPLPAFLEKLKNE